MHKAEETHWSHRCCKTAPLAVCTRKGAPSTSARNCSAAMRFCNRSRVSIQHTATIKPTQSCMHVDAGWLDQWLLCEELGLGHALKLCMHGRAPPARCTGENPDLHSSQVGLQ